LLDPTDLDYVGPTRTRGPRPAPRPV